MKDNNLNIQQKLQEFHNSSLVIKDFHPKILARSDSYNLEFYIEKVSKNTGGVYKSDSCFYGRLNYALRKLLKEVLKVETIKDDSIFDKYKEVRVKDCVKDIYEEVMVDFNNEAIKQKKLLKVK